MRSSAAVGDRRFVADRPRLSPASIGMSLHALVTAVLAMMPLGQVVGVLSTVVFGGVGYFLVPAVLIGTLACAWSLLRRDMVTYATATALIWFETWEWDRLHVHHLWRGLHVELVVLAVLVPCEAMVLLLGRRVHLVSDRSDE